MKKRMSRRQKEKEDAKMEVGKGGADAEKVKQRVSTHIDVRYDVRHTMSNA